MDLVTDLDRALIAAGWESESIRFVGFEEIRHDPYWRGPCGPAPDGGLVRTIATWGDGTLVLSPRRCD